MHPLYKNPEYVQAEKDMNHARAMIQEWRNKENAAWKIIHKLEEEYYYEHGSMIPTGACDNNVEDSESKYDDFSKERGINWGD